MATFMAFLIFTSNRHLDFDAVYRNTAYNRLSDDSYYLMVSSYLCFVYFYFHKSKEHLFINSDPTLEQVKAVSTVFKHTRKRERVSRMSLKSMIF